MYKENEKVSRVMGSGKNGKISILLVDDQAVVRQGLAFFIDVIDDLELAGEAADGEEAVRMAAELRPDVILMDVVMPRMNGIDAARAILAQNPEAHIIALTNGVDEWRRAQEALKAGLSGYFLKNTTVDELAGAIYAACDGEPVGDSARQSETPPLTEREKTILKLCAAGMGTREIAVNLRTSCATIRLCTGSILDKLDAHSPDEAVHTAAQRRII